MVNDNFEYLDDRITSVGSSITTLQSNIQSLNSTLSGQITQASNSLSAAYSYNGTFELNDVVVCDSLNRNIPNSSEHSEAIWLYSTPAYPYVPMTTQTSGTSHTFTNGGMVMCTSATNVTVGQGNSSITFTNFVGMLPVAMGAVVSTSASAYFTDY